MGENENDEEEKPMSEPAGRYRETIEEIQRARDELRVKLHLAAADARSQWEELEKKWQHIEGRAKVIGREAGHTAEEVGAALSTALDELRAGYARIRKLF